MTNTVVHVFATPWPPREGIARYVESLALALREIGINALLISLWDYRKIEYVKNSRGLFIVKIPRHRKHVSRLETIYAILQNQYLNKFLSSSGDASTENTFIHIHMPIYLTPSQKSRYGITFHGYNPLRGNNTFKFFDLLIPWSIIKKSAKNAIFVTGVGLIASKFLERDLRIPVKPVLTPIPYDVLRRSSTHVKRSVDRNGRSAHKIVLINAKNAKMASLIAKEILRNSIPDLRNIEIVVFGFGIYAKEVSREIIGPVSVKVFGFIDHNTLLELMSKASAFIYTSKGEGMPTLVLEALAMGTPTIVPRVQGCIDLAKMYGLPVYRNYKEAYILVRRVLEDYEYYSKEFDFIRERVLNVHHPVAIAKDFLRLYLASD